MNSSTQEAFLKRSHAAGRAEGIVNPTPDYRLRHGALRGRGKSHVCRILERLTAAALLLLPVTVTPAQEYEGQLVESAEDASSFFGAAVATHDEWVFVAAPFNAETGEESGAVYVYRFDGAIWIRTQKLYPMGGFENPGWFGFSVALDKGLAAVGAPHSMTQEGRTGYVCIYRLLGNVWIRETHLMAPDRSVDMAFGASVAIDSGRVLIGASSDSELGPRSGSAYIFRRIPFGWDFEAKIVSRSGRELDAFGKSVALEGNRAAVGAPWTRPGGVDAGSVHVFEYEDSTWVETATLTARRGASGDMFGESVSLSGNFLAVGASRAESQKSGAAYVYRYDDGRWIEEARLTAPESLNEHLFGADVSIREDVLFVGAPFFRAHQAPGSVYRFDRDGGAWSLFCEIQSNIADHANHMGQSLDWSGDRMVVGAFREPGRYGHAGSAFIFSVSTGGPVGESMRIVPQTPRFASSCLKKQ